MAMQFYMQSLNWFSTGSFEEGSLLHCNPGRLSGSVVGDQVFQANVHSVSTYGMSDKIMVWLNYSQGLCCIGPFPFPSLVLFTEF